MKKHRKLFHGVLLSILKAEYTNTLAIQLFCWAL